MRAYLIAVLPLVLATPSVAQHASPWLPPNHWSIEAVGRLHALGLARDIDPVPRQQHTERVAAVLRAAWLEAARAAMLAPASDTVSPQAVRARDALDPGSADTSADDARGLDVVSVLRLADGYLRRFAEEYPGAFARAAVGGRAGAESGRASGRASAHRASRGYVDGSVASGLLVRENAWAPGGFTLEREWTGPKRLPDIGKLGANVQLGGALGRRLAATAALAGAGADWRVTQFSADVRVGPAGLWFGRRAPGFAPAAAGLVLDGAVAFEGAGAYLPAPLQLPVLGPLNGEIFGGVLGRNGFVERPWLWGMRIHASPAGRIDIGVTRAAVFGGLNGARIGVRDLLEVLAGANLDGEHADNQVLSIDARWRPPAPVPLELHAEWGIHDADPGVFLDMPTFAAGARLPALPFAPAFGAAIEHVRMARSCCRNPPWYQHFELSEGWTADGAPLGHPLGGHGNEWRIIVTGAPRGARVQLDASGFRRWRGPENLFAPELAGHASGLAAAVDARLTARLAIDADVHSERGPGGRQTQASIQLRARL